MNPSSLGRPRLNIENHPLAEFVEPFSEHLRAAGKAESTVASMGYAIRRGLVQLPEVTLPALLDLIDSIRTDQRGVPRSAWRQFATFVNARQGAEVVPVIPPGTHGRPVTRATRTDALLLALNTLDPRVATCEAISFLRWRNVRGNVETATLYLDPLRGLKVTVTRAFIHTVAAEGFPFSVQPIAPDLPLFPAAPESNKALSEWQVARAIRRAQAAIDERRMRPWIAPTNVMGLKV